MPAYLGGSYQPSDAVCLGKGATWAETGDSGLIYLAGKWLPLEGGAIECIGWQLTRSGCRPIVRAIQGGTCSGKSI